MAADATIVEEEVNSCVFLFCLNIRMGTYLKSFSLIFFIHSEVIEKNKTPTLGPTVDAEGNTTEYLRELFHLRSSHREGEQHKVD